MPLRNTNHVIQEHSTDAGDLGHTERFTVKTGMSFWVDVDYSHPALARELLNAGQTIDTTDAATNEILKLAPEFEDSGEVTP